MSFVRDEVRALVGIESEPVISEPVSADALRRFLQATMEDNPVYRDSELAEARYGAPDVAPPLFPLHVFRSPTDAPDPLAHLASDPDWDALVRDPTGALLPIDLPFKRSLNGGASVEFFRLVRPGERVVKVSSYEGFDEREGRSGPFIVVRTRSDYRTEEGEPLITVHSSSIRR